jgi:uncharacterized cupredoxin-like copper-binding protein
MSTQTSPPANAHDEAPRINGTALAAMVAAVLALIIAVFALGRALAQPIGGGAVPASSEQAGSGAASSVAVSLTDLDITPETTTVSSDGVIQVSNDGAVLHNFKIKGTDVATADLAGGEAAELSLAGLEPGVYEFFCDIPGHESAGMSGSIEVVAGGGGDSTGGDVTNARADAGADHGMSGSADPVAMQQQMLDAMKGSIGSFPAETEGEGAAVLEPTILDDGTKLFELVVDEVEWEVEPGKIVDALGYNGVVPGPTMFVDTGDKVTIRVVNQLDNGEGTSLHPHGLKNHDFSIDGVTFISQDPIESGDAMDYTFVATEESVVTYHSHHMSLHQVPNGLFGAMIVGDYAELAGIEGVVDEQVMILNDAGNIGFSLNGKSFPATKPYQYTQGDKVVVHYANEGQMAHPMHLHNQDGLVIAKDGYLLPEGARYQGDTFNVAPGERLTVVYSMDNPGVWVWHCHILSHVKRSDGTMFGMLTAVIIDEAPAGDTTEGDA